VSVVRRRRPLLSVPTTSTSHHAPSGRLRRAIDPSSAPHCARLRPRRAPPCFDELSQPLHHVSGQASAPRAPPRRPLPRRPLLSLSRAPVTPHCQLRRELHLARVRRDHRQRGQTSLVPLPRRPLLSLSRAPVRPHCQLRRELHLAGVRRDHRQRGQTSLVHLWP